MIHHQSLLSILFAALIIWGCQQDASPSQNGYLSPNPNVSSTDMVCFNGNIYTMNEKQPMAEAVVVRDGKIVFVGEMEEARSHYPKNIQVLDLQGRTMIPGLIESHGHILGLGRSKRTLNLMHVKNYEELVEMVAEAVKTTPKGDWILGRGWHQSKWTPQPQQMIKGYQTHEALSAVSPDHPVFLTHASGHASFANAKAMEIAGINLETKVGEDGEIIRYPDGRATGIFSEKAENLVETHVPKSTPESIRKDLQAAIDECLKYGITSFQDAGSNQQAIDIYEEFVAENKMGIRLWSMLSGGDTALLRHWFQKGPLVGDHLSVRSIKLYSDGALGSRGAWLLEEYADRKGHFGNPIMPVSYIHEVSQDALTFGFQLCTHAIGDRANQEVLNQYEKAFLAAPDQAKDHRFRIEHAQHLHPDDIPRFGQLGVIASMQGIHMSSDRPWAIDRLGLMRIKAGAYVWQKLLQSGARIINGTDTPVEPVNPFASLFASITRQTLQGTPENGYEADQAMSRHEALKSYTLDAAYGAFEEAKKGSIEVGKFADFTVLSADIMSIPKREILDLKVLFTVVGGKILYMGTP
ncbi:MAG: amidohydrolase [Bacteroidota bacterium]